MFQNLRTNITTAVINCKLIFRFILLFILLPHISPAQFTYVLTGNPVNTTGWVMGTPTFVSGNSIVLNNAVGSTAGYIYYDQPIDLTGCAEFTVEFEYKISNSSIPPADGISFWYIASPPSAFTVGSGVGLPNNSTGIALFLDTYDNDANGNNPLISVRSLNNSNYAEGSSAGLIGTDVTTQSYITDGTWHNCRLVYNNGTITVSMDNNPPVITGNYQLNMTGYFGFSSSTGLYYSEHSIRNVSITGATVSLPVVNSPVTYCEGEAAVPLTATGTNLLWYDSATGGTASSIAPIPNTSLAGTTYYYVSQTIPGCGESGRDTIEVIVYPKPAPPEVANVTYCRGEAAQPLTADGQNLLWYDAETGGIGSTTAPIPATNTLGTVTYYVSQQNDHCESDRVGLTVTVSRIDAVLSPVDTSICLHETVLLEAGNGDRYQWYENFNYNMPAATLDCSDCDHPKATPTSVGDISYNVIVSNLQGCVDTLSAHVHVNPLPELIASPEYTTILYGSSVRLTATGALFYAWSPTGSVDYSTSSNPVVSPHEPTAYIVTGLNEFGCYNDDTCFVNVDYTNNVFIPSGFSPNGDGRNDLFKMQKADFLKIVEFKIYNRWGNEIFSASESSSGWDGNHNGRPAEVGTYFYRIILANPNGRQQQYKGDITLIR